MRRKSIFFILLVAIMLLEVSCAGGRQTTDRSARHGRITVSVYGGYRTR